MLGFHYGEGYMIKFLWFLSKECFSVQLASWLRLCPFKGKSVEDLILC